MKNAIILLICTCAFVYAPAQDHLLGLWEGVITSGGLQTNSGYRFELYILDITDKKLTGRSYVYLSEKEVVQMDIEGILYSDQSIYFRDVNFVELEGVPITPPYNRKYQIVYDRSIWVSTMEGYWQEIFPDPLYKKRQLGRIKLTKAKTSKP